jgi:hypothetical protein
MLMRLFSYIVTHDTGFAPNPFWGFCTLACCKPVIRRTANVRDWIIGLTPKSEGNRLIYAMQVEEIMTYDRYFNDIRFEAKIPDYSKGQVLNKCGDNIYKPQVNGTFQQLQSLHSNGLDENPKNKAHDLGGKNVLVTRKFNYFGSKALVLPEELDELKKVGRGHKNSFSDQIIQTFFKFIADQPEGVNAAPAKWSKNDESWRSDRS